MFPKGHSPPYQRVLLSDFIEGYSHLDYFLVTEFQKGWHPEQGNIEKHGKVDMGLRLNRNQGAKHLGCSRQYLSKIEKQGFIKRGADGLFDLDELKVTVCLQPKSPSSLKENIPVSKNFNPTR